MTLSDNHKKFESKCQQLIGWAIQRMQYAEIDYCQDNPQSYYIAAHSEIDTVNFLLSLFTARDSEVKIFCDNEFCYYGIGVEINEKFANCLSSLLI